MSTNTCAACGASFERPTGRGRPRLYCFECLPSADAPDYMVRWRQLNAERVRRYALRRVAPPTTRSGLRVPLDEIAESAGVPVEFVQQVIDRHDLPAEPGSDGVVLDQAYVPFIRTQAEAYEVAA